MRFPSIESRTGTFLPGEHWAGHELCFLLHDIMARVLVDGERSGAFRLKFKISDEELDAFNKAEDIFDWLNLHRTAEDRVELLVRTMFPAILSDMLHCIYEALECSRKGKLTQAYMLLRKPIQESLYVLEVALADRHDFAQKLTDSPVKLWSQGAGGRDVHRVNIKKLLDIVGGGNRFDADYLAQLRYDKSAEDGFDGVSNKAMHLFTSHKAIATEPMNINFIFSNLSAKQSQWSFLYTRLPYILAYTHRIIEAFCAEISPTYPAYLDEVDRRIAAHVLVWGSTLDKTYANNHLLTFVFKYREWLSEHCQSNGYPIPKFKDLVQMCATGAFPGEAQRSVRRRKRKFREAAELSGSLELTWLTRLRRRLGFKVMEL